MTRSESYSNLPATSARAGAEPLPNDVPPHPITFKGDRYVSADLALLTEAVSVPMQRNWYGCGYNSTARCAQLLGFTAVQYDRLKRHTPCRVGGIRGPLWPSALARYVSKEARRDGLRVVHHRLDSWAASEALMRSETDAGRPVTTLIKGVRGPFGQLSQHYRLILGFSATNHLVLDVDGGIYVKSIEELRERIEMRGPILGIMRGLGLYHRFNVLTFERTTPQA